MSKRELNNLATYPAPKKRKSNKNNTIDTNINVLPLPFEGKGLDAKFWHKRMKEQLEEKKRIRKRIQELVSVAVTNVKKQYAQI